MTILIRGGTVVNHDHSWRTDVLVDGDKIVGFGPSLDAPTGTEVIDALGELNRQGELRFRMQADVIELEIGGAE